MTGLNYYIQYIQFGQVGTVRTCKYIRGTYICSYQWMWHYAGFPKRF